MNIYQEKNKIRLRNAHLTRRWAKYQYNLITNLGENGQRFTGCAEHIALSRKIASEGMVLLENNGLLPLKENTAVALFGIGSLDHMRCGGGSGTVNCAYDSNLYEGFTAKAPRFSVYKPVTEYYFAQAKAILGDSTSNKFMSEPEIPAELVKEAAQYADVAIITIHRFSTEDLDRTAEKGDFYLADAEQAMVDAVTAAFDHCVVVLNVGGVMDVSWCKRNPKIDAVLLEWMGGMEGSLAVADILCGDVNPSGKLTDTFARSFNDYPSADTFHESDDYVDYFEDIYVGYRYFETIPEAAEKVVYPFGYGLSYTGFELSRPTAVLDGDTIKVSLSVKNTGKMAGKEVVQVYFSAPQGRLGKSKLSLIGFQKTKLLAPGETQDVTVSFAVNDMASYDDLGKCQMSAYVLEQGEYRFLAGNSCRNLQECAYRYTVSDEFIVTRQLQQRCAPNKLKKRMLSDGSFEDLPTFPIASYTPEVCKYIPQDDEPDVTISLRVVAEGKMTMDAFVAGFSDRELIAMVSGIPARGVSDTSGFGGITRMHVPAFMTIDGPAGVRLSPKTGIRTTAWPCATLVACTWDPELAYAIGKAGAMEAKEMAMAIWLTPALNIHRNPLCGRNFEYFSEDPLISGKFAAAKVRGIQSTNTAASAKHLACNNKETNRWYSDSRVSERALREIYLKGFEICVKESQPWTVMTSYNVINARRACENVELIEGILRQEWGFEGMVTSDWHVPCDQANCVIAGNDVRMPVGFPKELKKALEGGRLHRSHLEACVKRILGLFLHFD